MYDKELLESWCNGEDFGSYLARQVPTEDYKASVEENWRVRREYFDKVMKRISYCKDLLKEHDDEYIYYAIAKLYDLYDLDESKDLLFRRQCRYYCIKAIRKKRSYAPAWALLSEAYAWIGLLGGETAEIPNLRITVGDDSIEVNIKPRSQAVQVYVEDITIRCLEKAIRYISRAIVIDPNNEEYQGIRKGYYYERNEECKI
ncbi:MAG: hypothetical protein NT148_01055 [Candidatus Nealsonbacteria bacterium]|nr:hypothetical protein [Candidatus Nealsonbacteria bacterium]